MGFLEELDSNEETDFVGVVDSAEVGLVEEFDLDFEIDFLGMVDWKEEVKFGQRSVHVVVFVFVKESIFVEELDSREVVDLAQKAESVEVDLFVGLVVIVASVSMYAVVCVEKTCSVDWLQKLGQSLFQDG